MMSTSPGGAAAPAAVEDGEIGGLRQSIDKFRGTDTVYGVLSLRHFRLAGIVLFFPWRVVAEHLARRVLVAAATAADFFLLISAATASRRARSEPRGGVFFFCYLLELWGRLARVAGSAIALPGGG